MCALHRAGTPLRALNGKRIPEYNSWICMRRRCYEAKNNRYHSHGARHIQVCARWLHSFDAFFADMGPKPSPECSLERIDNDGNYEPGNCRWATPKEQANNTRNNRVLTLGDRTMRLNEWADELGIRRTTLTQRIDAYGWSVEQALTTPVRKP